MDTSDRKFHKLTCSNCRRKKAKCDGSHPMCSSCRNIKDAKCIYDKPASISYVRHLEKKCDNLQFKIDQNKENLSCVPFDFISPSMRNCHYFAMTAPNHINNLLNMQFNENYKSLISSEELNYITVKMNVTTPTRMGEEVIKHSFPFNLPSRILGFMRSFDSQSRMHVFDNINSSKDSNANSNLSPTLATIILAFSQIINLNTKDGDDIGHLKQQTTNLLAQAFFEPPTAVLASACLFHSIFETFSGGSFTRSWILITIASRISIELSHHDQTKFKRLAWACYLWDKFTAAMLLKEPSFPNPPPFPPSQMEFSLFDIIPFSSADSIWISKDIPDKQNVKGNINLFPVSVATCELTVVMSDVLSNTNHFLFVRLKLIKYCQQIYSNIPKEMKPDYCFKHDLRFPNETIYTYGFYLMIIYVLLIQMFEDDIQRQYKELSDNRKKEERERERESEMENETDEYDLIDENIASTINSNSNANSIPTSTENIEPEVDSLEESGGYFIDEEEFRLLVSICQKATHLLRRILDIPNIKYIMTGIQIFTSCFAFLIFDKTSKLLYSESFTKYMISRSIPEYDYLDIFITVTIYCLECLTIDLDHKSPIARELSLKFINDPPLVIRQNDKFLRFLANIKNDKIYTPKAEGLASKSTGADFNVQNTKKHGNTDGADESLDQKFSKNETAHNVGLNFTDPFHSKNESLSSSSNGSSVAAFDAQYQEGISLSTAPFTLNQDFTINHQSIDSDVALGSISHPDSNAAAVIQENIKSTTNQIPDTNIPNVAVGCVSHSIFPMLEESFFIPPPGLSDDYNDTINIPIRQQYQQFQFDFNNGSVVKPFFPQNQVNQVNQVNNQFSNPMNHMNTPQVIQSVPPQPTAQQQQQHHHQSFQFPVQYQHIYNDPSLLYAQHNSATDLSGMFPPNQQFSGAHITQPIGEHQQLQSQPQHPHPHPHIQQTLINQSQPQSHIQQPSLPFNPHLLPNPHNQYNSYQNN